MTGGAVAADRMRPRVPRSVLLTKAEALIYAADMLERVVADLELGEIIIRALGDGSGVKDEAGRAHYRELKSQMVEPGIQRAAIGAAAKAIRELATEERLVAARAAARGIGVES